MLHPATQSEAWVESSDDEGSTWARLQEYKPETTADTAMCYVEAKTGQRFRMHFADKRAQSLRADLAVKFFYDGHSAQDLGLQPITSPTCAVEGVENDVGYILPFKFKDLRTTNDERLACDTKTSEDVGQLRIEVWHIEIFGPRRPPAGLDRTIDTADLFLEQRVKKKSGHQVGFAEAHQTTAREVLSSRYKDHKPFIVFRFNYLSDALLDLNNIRPFEAAPPAPARNSSSTSRDLSAQPAAGSSEPRSTSATVKQEAGVGSGGPSEKQGKGKARVIEIDDDDDETEVGRLRAENARLRKKVKLENTGKKQVIDLSLD